MRKGWRWMGAGLLAGVLSNPGLAQQPDPEAVERAAQQAIRRVEAQEKAKEEAARKAQPPPALAMDHDREAWKSAEKCGTAACFEAYLENYPKGRYAKMARARLKTELEPESRPAVVTERPAPAMRSLMDRYIREAEEEAKKSAPNPVSGGSVVGSYALQENAYALRDYYRSQNVRAGVERIMVNDRPMYQVRVWR